MFTLTQFVYTCCTMYKLYICTECETNEEPMAIWEPFNPFSLLCSLKGSLHGEAAGETAEDPPGPL